jgi:SET domain-containing protein
MKRASRAVRVGAASCGRGVFAQRRFAPEETIAEIQGEVICDPDYGSDYCIDLGGSGVLEPAAPFCYLNHSCRPNCELTGQTTWDDAAAEIRHNTWLMALAEIAPGDELTIDYAWPAASAIPCLCGSANCRGWIVSEEQLCDVGGAAAFPETLER